MSGGPDSAPGGRRRRPIRSISWRWLVAVAAVLSAVGAAAHARTTANLPYTITDVWSSAVRFLRVDRGYAIREKDQDAGYILFDYPDAGKTYRGAVELVSIPDGEGGQVTATALSLPDLPRHHETALLGRLAARVREERGAPTPRRRAPPPPSPDGDKGDKGKDRDKDKAKRDGDGGLPRAPEAVSP